MGSSSSISRSASMEFLPCLEIPAAGNGKPEQAGKKKAKDKKDKKDDQKFTEKELSAEGMSLWLSTTRSAVLEVDRLKRLRLLLRNEAAS